MALPLKTGCCFLCSLLCVWFCSLSGEGGEKSAITWETIVSSSIRNLYIHKRSRSPHVQTSFSYDGVSQRIRMFLEADPVINAKLNSILMFVVFCLHMCDWDFPND